ncbi:stromelysin-3 isoform X2 [Hemicordylus capensis]|uniref:stromelysin-3 isoform X2 n=1 Tax=Hemicordylus capensis TaxID=884348 RepID=UPI0023047C27|nr:stromelysin-3 isoform X2 [Hemicordylus capensis]
MLLLLQAHGPAALLLLLLLLETAAAAPGPPLSHSPWKEQAPQSPNLGVDVAQDASRGSEGLAAQWNPPRCGVPDPPTSPGSRSGRNRQKRFVLSGGRWDKTDFTYKIVRFPWQLVKAKVRRVIAAALKVWSDVTPLTFTEVHSGEADIVIDFTQYWHGDNLPFDGPGGILAHAFFPKTHREGAVHFDYDESWSIGNHLGTDLLQVAAHEFGHVLGLQHTPVSKALMSPFYFFRYPLQLSEDDTQGIQYLYGKPKASREVQEEQLHPPEVETNEITHEQAALMWGTDKNKIYFFQGRGYWRYNPSTHQVDNVYPRRMADWRGVPQEIDAAFQDESGFAYFLKGQQYWKFDPVQVKVLDGYPRLIGQDFFRCSAPSNAF